jgi:uncharacterized protein YueI
MEEDQPSFLCYRVGDGYQYSCRQNIMSKMRWAENQEKKIFIGKAEVKNNLYKEYLNLSNKTEKCTCIKYVSSHIINYQHVSTTFAIIIIIRVAVQEC